MQKNEPIEVVAYRRVSTSTQLLKGQGLDEQKKSIEAIVLKIILNILF